MVDGWCSEVVVRKTEGWRKNEICTLADDTALALAECQGKEWQVEVARIFHPPYLTCTYAIHYNGSFQLSLRHV